jgi:hypothetical protein
MRKNVMPLLFKIFDLGELAPHRSKIFEVFDQMYNVEDNAPNRKSYATKRCLTKVLDHHKCKEQGFTLHNTLMIDSELEKILDLTANSILIKPYTTEDVLKPKDDQSLILMEVREYVFKLLDEAVDVPDYLA